MGRGRRGVGVSGRSHRSGEGIHAAVEAAIRDAALAGEKTLVEAMVAAHADYVDVPHRQKALVFLHAAKRAAVLGDDRTFAQAQRLLADFRLQYRTDILRNLAVEGDKQTPDQVNDAEVARQLEATELVDLRDESARKVRCAKQRRIYARDAITQAARVAIVASDRDHAAAVVDVAQQQLPDLYAGIGSGEITAEHVEQARRFLLAKYDRWTDPVFLLRPGVADMYVDDLRSRFGGGESGRYVHPGSRPDFGPATSVGQLADTLRSMVRHPEWWTPTASLTLGPFTAAVPVTADTLQAVVGPSGPLAGRHADYAVHFRPRGQTVRDVVLEARFEDVAGLDLCLTVDLGTTRAQRDFMKVAKRSLTAGNLSDLVEYSPDGFRVHHPESDSSEHERRSHRIDRTVVGHRTGEPSADNVTHVFGQVPCSHSNATWTLHCAGSNGAAVSRRLECLDCFSPRLKVALLHQFPRGCANLSEQEQRLYLHEVERRDILDGVDVAAREPKPPDLRMRELIATDGIVAPSRRSYDADGRHTDASGPPVLSLRRALHRR